MCSARQERSALRVPAAPGAKRNPGVGCGRGGAGTAPIYINKAHAGRSHLLRVRSGFNKAPVMLVPQLDETSKLHHSTS